ncbi:retrovirus-related Pol polyprotein from transposon 412 [Trichonephila clavipes]|nr:retrovirus-related Pol polyprotein from transposon 412 [Trichonephila clavipes]
MFSLHIINLYKRFISAEAPKSWRCNTSSTGCVIGNPKTKESSPNGGSQGLKGGPSVCYEIRGSPASNTKGQTPHTSRQRIGHVELKCGAVRATDEIDSFMNRVESLMSQKSDGKKTLKCWTCGREGHLQRSCRARQGAETNKRFPEGGVGKLINGHLVGRRLPDFGKPHIPVCQISTKSTGENGIFIMGHVNELPCNMIIDTGANVSIIRNDLAQKLKRNLSGPRPRGATDHIADPFILGLDFLKEHGFTLDFNKNELRSIHEEVTIFKIEYRTESIRQVTANENITIPPRTEIIVPGYIGNDVSFNSGLIGSAENKANGLLIASTLVDLSEKLSVKFAT